MILNTHFEKSWVVVLSTIDHNDMYPAIFAKFDLHSFYPTHPPPATKPSQSEEKQMDNKKSGYILKAKS